MDKPDTPADEIFDRALLQRRRERAAGARPVAGCDYLLKHVSEDIADRISLITRDFPLALNFGSHGGPLSQMIAELGNVGQIISSDAVPRLAGQQAGLKVVADEELFPFREEAFDLVVSALNLQWVNDVPGALVQIRRGLKPDGAFIAATLGGETLGELRHVMLLAEEELYDGASPRVAPFADVRDYGHLLQRAGFALPVTDRDVVKVRYGTTLNLMRDLRAMGASNMLHGRSRRPASRAFFARVEALYHEIYGESDGRLPVTFELVYLMGWAPHPDQQKPLRPGSGQVHLTDVFGKPPKTS